MTTTLKSMENEVLDVTITFTDLKNICGSLVYSIFVHCSDCLNRIFGGYAIGYWDHDIATPYVGLIIEILKVLELEKWEYLKGTKVRVIPNKNEYYSISAIGYITKNRWVSYESYLKNRGKNMMKENLTYSDLINQSKDLRYRADQLYAGQYVEVESALRRAADMLEAVANERQ